MKELAKSKHLEHKTRHDDDGVVVATLQRSLSMHCCTSKEVLYCSRHFVVVLYE